MQFSLEFKFGVLLMWSRYFASYGVGECFGIVVTFEVSFRENISIYLNLFSMHLSPNFFDLLLIFQIAPKIT